MKKVRMSTWICWILLVGLSLGACVGLHRYQTGESFAIELGFALTLLVINAAFFVCMHVLPHQNELFSSPAIALGGFGLKLFVNTFTIFIFIGLHAGRTHVFVWQFFGAYMLLLVGSVCLLTRKP